MSKICAIFSRIFTPAKPPYKTGYLASRVKSEKELAEKLQKMREELSKPLKEPRKHYAPCSGRDENGINESYYLGCRPSWHLESWVKILKKNF